MARFESGIEFWHRRQEIERMKERISNAAKPLRSESTCELTDEQVRAVWAGFKAQYETPEQRQIRRENYYTSKSTKPENITRN